MMSPWAQANALALGRIGVPAPAPQPAPAPPRHEWPGELAKDVRRGWQSDEDKARYLGFVRVNGAVDLESYRRAVEAPWRKL